jgi:hypothetical protein
MRLPETVIHADWGTAPDKRWSTEATLDGQHYIVSPPRIVTNPIEQALRAGGAAVVGFDFPIGVPEAFARKVGSAASGATSSRPHRCRKRFRCTGRFIRVDRAAPPIGNFGKRLGSTRWIRCGDGSYTAICAAFRPKTRRKGAFCLLGEVAEIGVAKPVASLRVAPRYGF